jgi:protein tyrosine phosphatase (PTP) superfamily phosphohydrolase (DUF442 family)
MLVAVITTAGITPAQVSAQDLLVSPSQLTAAPNFLSDREIDNFARVTPGITRGAQPSEQALTLMAKDGFKTIIDLRMNGAGTESEEAITKRLGMNYVHIPMTALVTPTTQQVAQFLSIVKKSENLPAFVHCRQGADRTGTVLAIYRRTVQGWDFEKTYAEMREHHFKPFLLGMKDLVKNCNSQNFDLVSAPNNLAEAPNNLVNVPNSAPAVVASTAQPDTEIIAKAAHPMGKMMANQLQPIGTMTMTVDQ